MITVCKYGTSACVGFLMISSNVRECFGLWILRSKFQISQPRSQGLFSGLGFPAPPPSLGNEVADFSHCIPVFVGGTSIVSGVPDP